MNENYNDMDIVPPVNVPTYNGPDRRYHQYFFAGVDNRSQGYALIKRYNTKPPTEKGRLINLTI